MSAQATVIIPTYNRAPYLRRVLDGLGRQDAPAGSFDVFVVDDGSTDHTAAVLAHAYPFALRSLRQDNGGPGAARNMAINACATPLIIFIDDDVIPDEGLVRAHLEAQARHPGAIIGPMLPAGVRQPVWSEWETRTLDRQYADMSAGRFAVSARQFYTANASVPRTQLVAAGLFDARFRRAEDVDLAYRLEDRLAFHFEPAARIYHDTPRTLGAWMRVAEQYGYYDVVMRCELGRWWILTNVADEYMRRNVYLRGLARAFVGRSAPMRFVRALGGVSIGVTNALRVRPAGLAMCSAVFNLVYWDAIARELGGRAAFWDTIARELRTPTPEPQPVTE
jgi:glycosyltransferase involved in cell wall biosynthesis